MAAAAKPNTAQNPTVSLSSLKAATTHQASLAALCIDGGGTGTVAIRLPAPDRQYDNGHCE